MNYRSYQPDHRVTIMRDANGFTPEDISADVIQISTNNAYGRAAGGFQVTTTFNPAIGDLRYDQIIKPDDIVKIELDAGDGSGLRTVMVGLVDRAARVRQFDGTGKPMFRCRIHGMDFGKLMDKHNCIADIAPLQATESASVKLIGTEAEYRRAAGLRFSGTPGELVKSIFDKLFLGQLDGRKTAFIAQWFPDQEPDDWQTYNEPILETTGSVWTAMKGVSNEPFNCLTTETYGDKLWVILEQFPFDPVTGRLAMPAGDPAQKMVGGEVPRGRIYTVLDDEIIGEDLGVSDTDRINYIYLKAPNFVSFGERDSGPPIQFPAGIRNDLVSEIQKHGFQKWEVETSFAPPGHVPPEGLKATLFPSIAQRADAIWARVRNNHTYESGTITIHGSPWIKAGDGILTDPAGMEYFVEQIAHTYQISAAGIIFTTSLGATRGQPHN